MRIPRQARCTSAKLAFNEGNFHHLFVLHRSMSEVAALAEQLAVVRGDGDVGVLGNEVEQFGRNRVQISHRLDLALAQHFQLAGGKHSARVRAQLTSYDEIIEMLKDTMN